MTGRPKRLILHVGMPKTGTTSIQAAMRANSEMLRAAGVMYPGPEDDARLGATVNHTAFFTALTGKAIPKSGMDGRSSCQDLLDDVLRTFRADEATSSLVISHELLVMAPEKLANSVALAWQDEFDLSVVLYVRPFREWIDSRYSQAVWARAAGLSGKNEPGSIRPVSRSLMMQVKDLLPSALHDKLTDLFPRAEIDMRSFVVRRKSGDLVEHFVRSTLPDGRQLPGELEPGEAKNLSRVPVIVMFAYHLLLGQVSLENLHLIARRAAQTNGRRNVPPPFADLKCSFLSDEDFRQLEEIDKQQAIRFPDLALDAPVSRGSDVRRGLTKQEFDDMLEWVKPYLPQRAYREAAGAYVAVP